VGAGYCNWRTILRDTSYESPHMSHVEANVAAVSPMSTLRPWNVKSSYGALGWRYAMGE